MPENGPVTVKSDFAIGGPLIGFTSAAGSLGMESSETRQGEWYLHLQSCVGELVRGPKWEISDR